MHDIRGLGFKLFLLIKRRISSQGEREGQKQQKGGERGSNAKQRNMYIIIMEPGVELGTYASLTLTKSIGEKCFLFSFFLSFH